MKRQILFGLIMLFFCGTKSLAEVSLKLSIPADNATDIAIDGTILLMFNTSVQNGSGNCTLNGEALTPNVVSTVVKFPYAGLSYSTDYEFVVPNGAITDKSGVAYSGITIHFKTMDKPEITPRIFDFIVDPQATPVNGKIGKTIQSAFDAIPNTNTQRFYIYIKNGTYKECLNLSENRQLISIIGENRDSVIIAHYGNPTMQIYGSNIYLENLTIQGTNNPDNTQYNHALFAEGKKNIYKNVRLLGHQDTQRSGGDRHYMKHCEIHGTIDFIYGSGNVFYDSCLIYMEARNKMMLNATTWDTACVIAAGSQEMSQEWGFVFSHCTIDGDPSNDGRYSLGRPWYNFSRAVYLHTTMRIKPFEYGWTSMGNPPTLYAEYGSVDTLGQAIDLSHRSNKYIYNGDTTTCDFNPVLTAEEAARYTLTNVLSGEDAWKPDVICANPTAPTPILKDSILTWERIPYSLCYIIRKDGQVVDFCDGTSYTAKEYGDYSVQTVGEYGFTSSLSHISYSDPAGIKSTPNDPIGFQVENLQLHLKDNNLSNVQLRIYDLCGKMIAQEILSGMETLTLPAQGLYLIKASHENNQTFTKVMAR